MHLFVLVDFHFIRPIFLTHQQARLSPLQLPQKQKLFHQYSQVLMMIRIIPDACVRSLPRGKTFQLLVAIIWTDPASGILSINNYFT